MTRIPYNCRICGGPGTVDAPPEYDPETHGQWLGMVCHDFCNDARVERLTQEDRIRRATGILLRLKDCIQAERDVKTEQIRTALIVTVKAWSKNESRWMGSRVVYWTEETVDAILENPNSWNIVLRNTRDFIRDRCHSELGTEVNPVWKAL